MKKGVVGVLSAAAGAVVGMAALGKRLGEQISEEKEMSQKHFLLFQMMNQWVKLKQDGKNLATYFEREGYKEIAIYGMHFAGETLVEELIGSDITVKYGIDRNAEKIYADFDVVTPDASLAEVDAIVVTAITFFDEIVEALKDRVDCPIISLEDILYQL